MPSNYQEGQEPEKMAFPTNPFPKSRCWLILLALSLVGGAIARGQSKRPLVTYEVASKNGLERAWFAQVRVDRTRYQVSRWFLEGDGLFAVTTGGTIHALNATSGKTIWSSHVGRAGFPALGPAANSKYVAVVSGSDLYLLDRTDGHLVWSKPLGGAPAAGPALSEGHAYATLMNGRVEAHRLSDPEAPTWFYQSSGKVFQRPTSNGAVFTWPDDQGHLYIAATGEPRILFRLKTSDEIVAAAAQEAPYLYVASLDGYLYSINEHTGKVRWSVSTGHYVTSTPAVIGDRVFVASEAPALHSIDATQGAIRWTVEGVSQFAAMGEHRVYGMDGRGTLLSIDIETGRVVGRLRAGIGTTAIVNDRTDRIFLVNELGLVQCLHEIGTDQPIHHREAQPEAEPSEDEQVENPFAEEKNEEGAVDESAEEEKSPFETDGDLSDDIDPFG